MELTFSKMFKPTVLALKLNRTHPSIIKDTKWILQVIIIQAVYTMVFMFFLNSIKCDFKRRDFPATCRNLCLTGVYLAVTIQYFTTLIYRQTLTKLFNVIKADYEKINNLSDDAKIVSFYAKKGRLFNILWLATTGFAFLLFPAKNIVLYIKQFYRGNEFKFVHFYELTYPDIIEEIKNDNIVIYVVSNICLFFYAAYSTVTYVAFVPLGPIFMLHACGQLELIKRRIDKLFDGSLSAREINVELADISRRLQFIYSFVEEVKECMKVVYELVLKTNVIKLPVTAYLVIQSFNEGQISVEFVMFVVGGSILSATPCYYSDLLMSKSEEVRQAIYMCGWERQYDRSTRSTLLILLTRAVRPIAIRTIFRTISLEALTELFQQSYAIFNLMNAMWN